MSIRRVRNIIFLKDVSILSLTAFGGPQGHFGMFLDLLVGKRGYLTEEDLIELYALCQILPGPTSTQTITALGYKIGGPNLAYLTLLVWMFPAFCIMTTLAILVTTAQDLNFSLDFIRFIEPIAVGIVAYSSYRISIKVVNTKVGVGLMILSAFASFIFKSPYAFPILILFGGLATTWKYKKQPIEEKERIKVKWANLILWVSVLVFAAVLGGVTQYQPIKLFENFYRNGSLIFGGGQVLVPLLYTEFVEFKQYLTSQEFVSGYGFVQAIPGPVFSFSAYVGAISARDLGMAGQLLGAGMAAIGVFLPGTFLIFFVIRFWEQLKKYRIVKASLEGIVAVSAGMVIAAAFLLFMPMEQKPINFILLFATVGMMHFTKIPTPLIIVGGLVFGIVIA
ncbi:chromate transporter [Ekhidna lutea]|uniref:Chromate transporter n=1 Tax=Ekhidna lutea TaxID=447679 RepID=A0A239F302_EKHLU|nr:chromate efflux transporter [Ekhidna lutea]SNS50484.1 chromate transporter [Ekhidna lutea]